MPRIYRKEDTTFLISQSETAKNLLARRAGLGHEASMNLTKGDVLRYREGGHVEATFEFDNSKTSTGLVPFTDLQTGLDVDMSITMFMGTPTRNAIEVERLGGKWVAKRNGLANPLTSWRQLDELNKVTESSGLAGMEALLKQKDLRVLHILAEPKKEGFGHFSFIWGVVNR